MKRILRISALIFAACALLCVGLWATVWSPDGVADSQADILDLFPAGDETTTTKFQRALDHLGHETPRAFDLNGNTIYFSVNFLAESPIDVLERYQDEFVYQGINQKSHTSIASSRTQQGRKEMLTGGIVPIEISSAFVSMGGGVTENGARDEAELAELAVDLAKGGVQKQFRAYRHIEAFREEGSRTTTVVASWSDEAFDYRKMQPNSRVAGQVGDARVPACPGCTRLQRFEDLDPTANHVDYIFIGQASVEKTVAFYDRALVERGWEHAPSSAVLARARRLELGLPDAHVRHYLRDQQTLTLTSYVGPQGDTLAHLSLSN